MELKAVGLMRVNHLCETSTKVLWAIKRSLTAKNKTLWTHYQLKKKKHYVLEKSEESEKVNKQQTRLESSNTTYQTASV